MCALRPRRFRTNLRSDASAEFELILCAVRRTPVQLWSTLFPPVPISVPKAAACRPALTSSVLMSPCRHKTHDRSTAKCCAARRDSARDHDATAARRRAVQICAAGADRIRRFTSAATRRSGYAEFRRGTRHAAPGPTGRGQEGPGQCSPSHGEWRKFAQIIPRTTGSSTPDWWWSRR